MDWGKKRTNDEDELGFLIEKFRRGEKRVCIRDLWTFQ